MATKLKTAKQIPVGGKIIEAGNSKRFKTGSWKAVKPVIDKNKCINCLKCAAYCPEMAIKVKNGKIDYIDLDFCKGCGICAAECPMKAIKMEKVHKKK